MMYLHQLGGERLYYNKQAWEMASSCIFDTTLVHSDEVQQIEYYIIFIASCALSPLL
jgi:hypothetical protein